MGPLFGVRKTHGGPFNPPKATREADLDRLDHDRAVILARLVADADGSLKLDGTSDALRRAVEVASEAGWITPTRTGYVVGPVEVGSTREARSPVVRSNVKHDPTRTVAMVVAYLERTDHPPTKVEIMKALNLSNARMNAASVAGRAAGEFYSGKGRPGYRLGRAPS
ncbi:MAG TPA: hypothetical protein VLK58_28385 [Conexibacter sp.]|nr:hypothetical protein [Conexibacter sp.]